MPERPEIICCVGSSRFSDAIAVIAWGFEKTGKICFALHFLPDWYWKKQDYKMDSTDNGHLAEKENVAHILDELHLRKIDMCDKVYVCNIEGYIGERTKFEIEYAKQLGKTIDYFEPI